MSQKRNALFPSVLWLLVPSVIWSAVFHTVGLCVDPLILQALNRRLPRPWMCVLLSAWAMLFVIPLLFIWNILPGTYLFYLREALPFSPPSVLISVALTSGLILWFIFYGPSAIARPLPSRVLMAIGAGLLLSKFAIIAVAGSGNDLQKKIKSPAITAAGMWYEAMFVRKQPASVAGTLELSFNSYVRKHMLPPKVVLMVVESWSETPAGLEKIVDGMRDAHFNIVGTGFTTYRGSTLSGELRELCSRFLAPTDGVTAEREFDCAPRYLANIGYQTLGVHAYKAGFYARNAFWQRFGLEKRWFGDVFEASTKCPGPFQGACDSAIIERGVKWLQADESRRFLYLLTLSSHEPIFSAALAEPPGRFFNQLPVLHPTQQIARRALSSMMVELERAKGKSCILGYVAGDHAPPSAPPGMFESDKVPFIVFEYNCS